MASINVYPLDTLIAKNDKVIGTDSSGTITKNYSFEKIEFEHKTPQITLHAHNGQPSFSVANDIVWPFKSNSILFPIKYIIDVHPGFGILR